MPPETYVLRGGSDMTTLHLIDRFEAHATRRTSKGKPEEFCLSVNAIPGLSVDEIAARAQLIHPKVRVSTVGALADVGFEVDPDPRRQDMDGHCSVYLSRGREHLPNGIEIARLVSAFSKPMPNAGQKRQGSEK